MDMQSQTLEFKCNFIDICYPDYLTDHHNRKNELLLFSHIVETSEELISNLLCLIDCVGEANKWRLDKNTEQKIENAVKDSVSMIDIKHIQNYRKENDYQGDSDLYMYFYLTWQNTQL